MLSFDMFCTRHTQTHNISLLSFYAELGADYVFPACAMVLRTQEATLILLDILKLTLVDTNYNSIVNTFMNFM